MTVKFNAKQLCKNKTALYPEIGACGIDVGVTKDTSNKTWVVGLKKEPHSIIFY